MSANDRQAAGTHYKDMGIQPWDVIDTWPLEQQLGFHRGSILGYVMRMGTKPGDGNTLLSEALKINHYSEKLVEVCKKIEEQAW